MKQLSGEIALRAVEGLCLFRGYDPVTGAGKRHASVGFYMLRGYKCAEFCIGKGQSCVADYLGMDALVVALTETRAELWFGHGCSGERVLLEHERKLWLGH